jgi:hypothetical protein
MKAKQKNMHLKKVTEQYHQCGHLKYHHYVAINITIITLPSTSPNTTITDANGEWSVMMVFILSSRLFPRFWWKVWCSKRSG